MPFTSCDLPFHVDNHSEIDCAMYVLYMLRMYCTLISLLLTILLGLDALAQVGFLESASTSLAHSPMVVIAL